MVKYIMALFDKKSHIKSTKELDRVLKKERYLTPAERRIVEAKTKKFIRQPSGLSKEEWRKKVLRPMERDPKDKIDRGEVNRLKKLGK